VSYSVLSSKNRHNLRAPLRNRTVDLLLTMNPREVSSPQVTCVDLAKQGRTRALASSRWALTSTVLTLNLSLTLILFQRASDYWDCPSKMRAIEGDAPRQVSPSQARDAVSSRFMPCHAWQSSDGRGDAATNGAPKSLRHEADGFTARVRHEAHCCIARAAGRD
jgi:hypothetical protein